MSAFDAPEQDPVLRELAELGLAVARGLKARFEGAQADEAAERLAAVFERVGRGVRLTVALQSRLVRDRAEAESLARRDEEGEVKRRKAQVRAALASELRAADLRAADQRTGAQGAPWRGDLRLRLEERLTEDALFRRLLDGPVEAAIARIRADIGLPPLEGSDGPARSRPARSDASRSGQSARLGEAEPVWGFVAEFDAAPPDDACPDVSREPISGEDVCGEAAPLDHGLPPRSSA